MTTDFFLESSDDAQILLNRRILNATTWSLGPSATPVEALSPQQAMQNIGKFGTLRHLVVGIIGPREATTVQLETAERIGYQLGSLGITLICGGKSGVMEAASRGCAAAGGLMIGILPDSQPNGANPFVGIPLPTGLSEARNMVIAKAARVLIAVGGSYGTLSEVAYGLHFSRPVIGIEGAPQVTGVRYVNTAEEAVDAALLALFAAAVADGTRDGCNNHDRPAT